MPRSPLRAALLLSLVALAHGAARAEMPKATAKGPTCAVYSLAAAGDAAYGKWVADTIPQVIDPEAWSAKADRPVLTYNPTRRVLVVRATPAVQAKVAAFIKDLEKAGAAGGEEASSVQADKATLNTEAVPAPPTQGASYPVPAPVRQPKHLLHFVIRYEGAGFIDSNVVKYVKAQAAQQAKADAEEKKAAKAVPDAPAERPSSPLSAVPAAPVPSTTAPAPATLPKEESTKAPKASSPLPEESNLPSPR